MTIKAGWMLQVTSWENDGDYYNTKTIDGLTKEEVQISVALCRILQSLRQEAETDEVFIGIAAKLGLSGEGVIDHIQDMIYDLIGTTEYGFIRVCESWEVYYIPFDIPSRTNEF